jgi:hypothetical protein
VVNLSPSPTEELLSSPFLIYYLGEINQARKIDNWLYETLKTQGIAVTLSNNKPLPSFIKIANDKV